MKNWPVVVDNLITAMFLAFLLWLACGPKGFMR